MWWRVVSKSVCRAGASPNHLRGCANLDSALPSSDLYLLMFIFAESSGSRAAGMRPASASRHHASHDRPLQGALRYDKHPSSTSGILIRYTSSLNKGYTASPRAIHSPKSTRSSVLRHTRVYLRQHHCPNLRFQTSASSTCVGQGLTLSLASLASIGQWCTLLALNVMSLLSSTLHHPKTRGGIHPFLPVSI